MLDVTFFSEDSSVLSDSTDTEAEISENEVSVLYYIMTCVV